MRDKCPISSHGYKTSFGFGVDVRMRIVLQDGGPWEQIRPERKTFLQWEKKWVV